jgi:hypothetical protein
MRVEVRKSRKIWYIYFAEETPPAAAAAAAAAAFFRKYSARAASSLRARGAQSGKPKNECESGGD